MKVHSFNNILTLAIPTVLSGIAEPLIGATDLVLVGDLGEKAIAVVGIGGTAMMSFVWIVASFLMALSARVAFYYGAKHNRKLLQLVNYLYWRLTLLLLLLSLVAFLMSDSIIAFFNPADSTIQQLATDYFNIRLIGFSFIIFSSFSFQIFKGLQNTLLVLYITLAGTGLNLILDFGLIQGLWGLPNLGVLGAAWSSATSQVLMGTISFTVLYRTRLIKKKVGHYDNIKVLFNNSFNLFLRTLLLNSCIIYGNKITASSSATSIATHTIMANMIINISYFMDGVANAGSVIIGRLKGAKHHHYIKLIAYKCLFINTSLWLFATVSYLLFDQEIIQLYTTTSAVFNAFKEVENIYLVCLFAGSFAFTFDGIYIGLENTSFLRNVLLIATLLVYFPTIYIHGDMNLHGVWLAFAGWMIVRGFMPLGHFVYLKKY